MNPDLGGAARTLTLDLAAGEVIRALDAAGIDCMLLKGPAMARHLYGDAPGGRNYGDIDVLVPPGDFGAAGLVLDSLGFQDRLVGIRASEADRLEGRPWHRRDAADVVVDLHRGFHHVVDRAAWWALLGRHREVIVVEGQPMAIPDRVGCAVIAALHASKASSLGKPAEDLRRALRLFDDEIWREAAELARSVGAGEAFAAALCRESAGLELAGRLGLAVTDPVAWFWATSRQRGAGSLSFLLAAGTWTVRAQRLRDAAFPSAAVFVGNWPIAARGRSGLALARLGRLCVIVVRLPRVLLAWHRTAGALRRGGPASGGAGPARAHRALRVRGRAVLATSWWTLRVWWRIHRGLARGPRRAGAVPALAPYSARAARLVLACCRSTCLETALVRQARAAGRGVVVDVVVGVTPPAGGFRAHAWLDGDRVDPQFVELCRFPAAGMAPDRRRAA
jgi:Uncharacterised nucleotidyltransferase/Transglutaminase-like superfamily